MNLSKLSLASSPVVSTATRTAQNKAMAMAMIDRAERVLRHVRLELAIAEDRNDVRAMRALGRDEQVAKAALRAALAL